MRALITICLVAAVFAADTNKFAVLLQTGTRGNDAVESVYNLLRDLKTENVNAVSYTHLAGDSLNHIIYL